VGPDPRPLRLQAGGGGRNRRLRRHRQRVPVAGPPSGPQAREGLRTRSRGDVRMDSLSFALAKTPLREVNQVLHRPAAELDGRLVRIDSPDGAHNIAVGLDAAVKVLIDGHAGYYAGGMNQHA